MKGRRALAVAAASLAGLALVGVPAGSAAAGDCSPPLGRMVRTEPWAQHRLNFQKAWRFTNGAGVLIGEIDSGVEASHPQLRGQVLPTVDLTNTTTLDCSGHGTMVAGIMVGSDLGDQGIVFTGVAPGAKLLPFKQTDTNDNDPNGVARLADGIRKAADDGVKVLNISIVTSSDVPQLRDAVLYAQQHDVLIVAAAGNEDSGGGGEQKTAQFPANYPGVVGVAAIDEKGERADFSVTATQVSVAAPGSNILSTASGPNHGYTVENGTSFATPFVSGVAALVRAYHPELTYQQVKHRLEVTADPTADSGLGAGVVNPLQAVTAVVPDEAPQRTQGTVRPLPPPRAAPVPDTHTRNLALAFAAGAGGVSGLVLVGAVVIPRGRRRGWRPGQRAMEDMDDAVIGR